MVFTTPLQENSIKIMLLGSGELGKEVTIEAQRLGVEVIAVGISIKMPQPIWWHIEPM